MSFESDKLLFSYEIPDNIFTRNCVFQSLQTYIRQNMKVEREIDVPTSTGECSVILLDGDIILCLEKQTDENGELTDDTVTVQSNKEFLIDIRLAFRNEKYDFHEQKVSIEFK